MGSWLQVQPLTTDQLHWKSQLPRMGGPKEGPSGEAPSCVDEASLRLVLLLSGRGEMPEGGSRTRS